LAKKVRDSAHILVAIRGARATTARHFAPPSRRRD